jgi:hypothetical protein
MGPRGQNQGVIFNEGLRSQPYANAGDAQQCEQHRQRRFDGYIHKGDKLSVAACFSIYAYQALKKQLDGIAELRFIFTSLSFFQEKAPKEKREFYIPRLDRERSLYGTEFEVKLRNELTQKAIARECADWIRKKVQFRSNLTGGNISGFMNVVGSEGATTYMPLLGFTTSDIGCERGNIIINPVHKMYAPLSEEYICMFEQVWNDKNLMQDVTDQVIDGITAAYQENSPEFIYFVALTIFSTNFWTTLVRTCCPTSQPGSKKLLSGISSMTFIKTQLLPS